MFVREHACKACRKLGVGTGSRGLQVRIKSPLSLMMLLKESKPCYTSDSYDIQFVLLSKGRGRRECGLIFVFIVMCTQGEHVTF